GLEAEYHKQVNPREINLFYNTDSERVRIEKGTDGLYTQDGAFLCKTEEIDSWSDKNKGEISANVVLRPLMQECLLPNIAYIGGPGELAYWLQLKEVFAENNIPFPIVENRKS